MEVDLQKEIAREGVLDALSSLYDSVLNIDHAALNDDDIAQLRINVEDFSHGQSRRFFKPSTGDIFKRYPIIDNADSRRRLRDPEEYTKYLSSIDFFSQAGSFASHIVWWFNTAHREGIPEFEGLKVPLGHFMGWRSQAGFGEGVFKNDYISAVFYHKNPMFRPSILWERSENRRDKPHLMFTLQHDIPGEERLLRGELLAILAAMQSRLSFDSFKEHLIIPTQVLSFMGHTGRIIQAYHDGENLVIRKSWLFDFSNFDNGTFNFFVRHLANEPIGNTKELTPKPSKRIPLNVFNQENI